MIEKASIEGIVQALMGMAHRVDSTDLLALISCSTLVVVGNEDKLTPPSDAEKMSRSIKLSSLESINNAGHLPNIEYPTSFNLAVIKFLNQLQH